MLIAHSASTCDVCLEGYNENCSYHCIPCGHVFCLPCLVSTSPSRCPLCRHEFSAHSVRKVHLTLPSARDLAARRLELKLVQSSPDMSLAESLLLFQEVQEWLEGQAQDEEFLVLRAFAAVMCGFHETKDRLLQTQERAKKDEAILLQSLEEVRSATSTDEAHYKAKYEAAITELDTLRTECADLRTRVEQAQRYNIDIHNHYAQARMQTSDSESQHSTRRISNPLPAPPRPIDLKLLEARSLLSSKKGKGKNIATQKDANVDIDPMASAFVPTLSASITTQNPSSSEGVRSEVTTLVFKPPKRMPVWDSPNSLYAKLDAVGKALPSAQSNFDARLGSHVSTGDQAGNSHTHTRSVKVEHPHKASSVDSTQLEHVHRADSLSRPASYIDGGYWTNSTSSAARLPTINWDAGPFSRHAQQSQPQESKHNSDDPRVPSRPALNLQLTANAGRQTSPTPLAHPMLPVASGHMEPSGVGLSTLGVSLHRASSPVVMSSDTIMPFRPDDVPAQISHPDVGRDDRDVARPYARAPASRGSSGLLVNEIHLQRQTPSSMANLQGQGMHAQRAEADTRRSNLQDEHMQFLEHRAARAHPSLRKHPAQDSLQDAHYPYNHKAPVSHDRSQTPASQFHRDNYRPPSPTRIRERAQSHPHPHPAPSFHLRRRSVVDISPLGRRITMMSGPGATFHLMDPNTHVVAVREV